MSSNASDPKFSRLTDRELIGHTLAGHREAYAELMRRHYSAIRGLCLSILASSSDADDAVQEIFVRTYSRLSEFQGRSAFGTWLYRIAVNHCLCTQRKRTRQRAESLDALSEGDKQRLRQLIEAPDESGLENSDLVHRALSRLESEHRMILTLREMRGLEYRELMESLDCSMDAVKARLWRARAAFRGMVREIMTEATGAAEAERWNTKR